MEDLVSCVFFLVFRGQRVCPVTSRAIASASYGSRIRSSGVGYGPKIACPAAFPVGTPRGGATAPVASTAGQIGVNYYVCSTGFGNVQC